MLSALELQDFAIIDALRVGFAPGLNVLTGETGAGKSILVDALGLLIGGRAEARVVRSGAQSALIQGFFTDAEPDDLVTARRVQASGRSSARISGELVTIAELAERGGQRLAIHGQHASQTLLGSSEQRRLLDNLLGNAAQETLTRYGERYRRFTGVARELAALQGALRERARQLDVLGFQVLEIAAAKLQQGEEETIRVELESLRYAERVIQGSAGAVERLSEGEPNALALLAEAVQGLESAGRYHAVPAALGAELRGALESVQATSAEVESFLADFGGDPERLETLEHRLSLIETLKLKYGSSVEEVLAFYAQAEAEMTRLQNAEGDLAQLQKEQGELASELAALADALTNARQQAATKLSEAVTRELRPLGMTNA